MKNIFKYLKPSHIIYLIWILAVVFLVTGPVWVSNREYFKSEYFAESLENLEKSDFLQGEGELYAGWSRVRIPTEPGQPIMGYTDRGSLESKGELSPLFARAITVKAGGAAVTIVSADVMILMGDIIDDIYKETGLDRDEIYFTATHTHSGAGGWYEHPILELFYGKYSQKYYDALKGAIVEAIISSRDKLVRARMKYVKVDAGMWLENRNYNESQLASSVEFHGVNPYFTAIAFVDYNDSDRVLTLLSSFAAHATVIRKNVERFSSDYPGRVCNELRKLTGAEMVLFAAGSVGDARATVLHEEGAASMGNALAEMMYQELEKTDAVDVTEISSMYLPIRMPGARLSLLGPYSSVFPLISSYLFDNPVHISYLQIGESVLAGMPVDMAGELTKELQDERPVLVTSFNGSWKGYATKEDTYLQRDTYSTRSMGLGGAQAGILLMDFFDRIDNKNRE